jgi:hypothetical protein
MMMMMMMTIIIIIIIIIIELNRYGDLIKAGRSRTVGKGNILCRDLYFKNLMEIDNLQDVSVDGRIILKWV